jgi:hypothetical protein
MEARKFHDGYVIYFGKSQIKCMEQSWFGKMNITLTVG